MDSRARASSQASRAAPASLVSLSSRYPAGSVHSPARGGIARLQSRILPSQIATEPTTTLGLS